MGENIFAIQLSQAQPQQVNPVYGQGIHDGYRAILSVTAVWAKLQTTVLFGNSLYMIWYDIGQLTRQDGFRAFLRAYFKHSIPAAQLSQPPYAATPNLYNMYIGSGNVAPEAPPVSTGNVTMLDAGFDPFRGYWIEFHGNYFLHFPLFQNWPTVIRETSNYKGFQPNTQGAQGGGPNQSGNNQSNPSNPTGTPSCMLPPQQI